jgi:signal peptidase II
VTPRRLGLLAALAGLAADQAVKLWVLRVVDLGATGPIPVAPIAEFRLVWNYGISYGLLRQDGDLGRWLLVAFALVAAAALAGWLWRQARPLPALSLGLVVGGAVGNAIDRAVYGAVVDYAHLFLPDRSFSWYVFNLADVWIVAGVVGLVADSLFGPKDATKATEEGKPD